ncbi:MAG: winged helix-turn-helix transcriptional regulator [Bulleidia sp.]
MPCKKNPTITQKEIAGLLQVNTNTLKYRILRLRKAGKIEREGSPQKGQWIVK